MRVAIVTSQFPSLSETFILNQVTGLIDRGHDVHVFAHRRGGEPSVHSDVLAYDLDRRTYYRPFLPANPVNRLAKGVGLGLALGMRHPVRALRLLNVLRYGRTAASLQLLYGAVPFRNADAYDVIHCHFANNAIAVAYLRESGVVRGRMLTTFHGHDVNRYPLEHGANVYRRLFATCELFTSNTDFTADQAAALGCRRDRILKLPVGVNMSAFAYASRLPRPGEPVRVLTVGRLVEKKGIEVSIRAVAEVVRRHRDVVYQIVGDGELRSTMERLVDELGVRHRVLMLGWKTQADLREIFADAHIFMLASLTAKDGDREGQGLVLQEAQAMGLPVLTTRHNGIPEGVLDGRTGYLVPEGDVSALADKLAYLVDHPEDWERMGREGRTFVEQRFDIEALNDRLVAIYTRLADGEFDA